eukprot:TRINITY_DN25414_c0_g1_i1.p1 TRINITY_DN25414_c0_g1~~TRINITY_DN25414_c0_g1_i1.p1  ORF type:complete len:516 (-),score=95.23 TRINITY_DN25414_c0_g1_i1:62-1609(-)
MAQAEWPPEHNICVVDADSVGAPRYQGKHSGLDTPRIYDAVANLQQQGFRVILVSRCLLAPELDSLVSEDGYPALDKDSLLHERALNPTYIDVIKVAEQYGCYFVTDYDVANLEDDWRLPKARQTWLQRNRQVLHVTFDFDQAMLFRAHFPPKVHHSPTKKTAAEDHSELLQASTVSKPYPSATPDLPDHSSSSSSAALAFNQGRDMASASATVDSTFLSEASGTWISDYKLPPMAVLKMDKPGRQQSAVVCVLCEEMSQSMFQSAISLAYTIECREVVEVEDDPALENLMTSLFKQEGGPWAQQEAWIVTKARGGRMNDLWAIGVGGKKKARRRAAHLALVLADRTAGSSAGNPEVADLEVNEIISRARSLMSTELEETQELRPMPSNADSSAARRPPPPPPPTWPPARPSPRTLADLAAAGDLKDQVVKATAAHPTSADSGYLDLRVGDYVRVLYGKIEPPGEGDVYKQGYAYGHRVDNTGIQMSDQPVGAVPRKSMQGWLPIELVEVVELNI